MDERGMLGWTRLKADRLGAAELHARLLAVDTSGFGGEQVAEHQRRVRRAGEASRRLGRSQAACWAVLSEGQGDVGAELQAAVSGQVERFFRAWGGKVLSAGYRRRLGEWLRANAAEVLGALPALEPGWPSYCEQVRAALRSP